MSDPTSLPEAPPGPQDDEKALKLLRQHLAHGPGRARVEAAAKAGDVSSRALLAATDALGIAQPARAMVAAGLMPSR